jgi:hypothetical protein
MRSGPLLRRTVATGTVALLVTSAFAAGLLVADARSGDDPGVRLTAAGLHDGLSCDALRGWYVDHGVDQVTAWGWQELEPIYNGVALPGPAVGEDSAGDTPSASLDTVTGSSTGTNVQEVGVDEPDLVKTTGSLLVRIAGGALKTDDVSGTEPRRLGVAPLDRIGNPQLLLAGDRAIVIGAEIEDPAAGAPLSPPPPRTWVRTYDLADPTDPTLVDSRLYDGSLVTARQVGPTVRLVLDGGLPALDFEQPSSSVTEQEALQHNQQVVRASSVSDWLPQVTTYDTATQGPFGSPTATGLVDCSGLSIPETFNGLGTLTVVGFDAATPDTTDATAVATASDTAYMSTSHLYVAVSPWWRGWQGVGPMPMPSAAAGPTRLYGFDLSGTSATYVGMGSVDGTIAGAWSMDEHDGDLRVAVASSSGSTSVVVLRPESGRLLDVGHLDGLGVGQQLKSVRWFGDLAVLVTFRQTDPFYVVDVADPTDPHVLGALHLPGWSSYLHPVGPHLVLGLGQTAPQDTVIDAPPVTMPPVPVPPKPTPEGSLPSPAAPDEPSGSTFSGTLSGTASAAPNVPPTWKQALVPEQHAKATLFDISDLANPREVDTVSYPRGSFPLAGSEPHQVTWLPDSHTLLTVLEGRPDGSAYDGTRVWVSVLTIHDDSMESRLVRVPTIDTGGVRTVPLADGRVVLIAGDSVSFLTV